MKKQNVIAGSLVALCSGLVLAHSGADAGMHHGSAFISGLLHPLSGMDHLAAMLAVGIWSAQSQRKVWTMPALFMCLLLVGGVLGLAGLSMAGVEPMIAASLLVLGLLISSRAALPQSASLLLVAGFALFHGVAHGTELAASQAAAALAGMLLASLALHISGIAIGRVFTPLYARISGAAIALLGIGYLASAF